MAFWLYVVAGAIVMVLYFTNPLLGVAPQWAWRFSLDMVLTGSAAVALVAGICKWRPSRVLPWWLLAVSQAVYAGGDFAYYWDRYVSHVDHFPGLADAFYLGRVPFIVVGLVLIVRGRDGGRDQAAIIDSLIVGISAGVLSWVFLMEPYTEGAQALSVRLASLAYPVTDLMLVVIALRLLAGGGRREISFYLLTGGLVLLVATDSLYAWGNLKGVQFNPASFVELGWLAYYLSVGACGLHPSMRDLAAQLPRGGPKRSHTQLLALGAATLVGPVLLVVESRLGRPLAIFPIAPASCVITVLVVIRLALVMRDRERAELRFRTLAGAAPIGIIESSPLGGVYYANPRAEEISGRTIQALEGARWMDLVHPDDARDLSKCVERAAAERSRLSARFRIQRPDGEIRHVQLVAVLKGGRDLSYVATISDITEETLAHEALRHQAFYDTLTGLPNRALFLDRLNRELSRRGAGHKVAVLLLDLDRFKVVNDSLGHDAGDAVLSEVGKRFARRVRAADTAARMGGDEFIFIISDVGEVEDAVVVAKGLLAVLEPPIRCAGQALTVTGSIGIVLSDDGADAASLLRDADTAMFHAKDLGGNRCAVFDRELRNRSVRRLALEGELRQSLAGHEFEVYYQPIVDLATGQPTSAEALVRWHHPRLGLVPPLQFIPVAEESGLINQIGRLVFEQTIGQLSAWDTRKDRPRLDGVAVNFSPQQLEDPEATEMVRNILERYHIAPGRVCVEVTETAMMTDNSAARRTLADLKHLGLQVAIDDFGTGYSSLAKLHTLPVTTIKIDRCFIERMGAADDSTPLVRAIIDMSHAMGLRVVAEGVSDRRQAAVVSDLGCELAQGFYWACPMSAESFANWWRGTQQPAFQPLISR